ncbi:MAG: efflux RND transporter periplasmic adaptor subunit [Myxococcales bacterium]|nr:efflux RND transporter periplasmic adaptor subunit [Myxococcales bacterium]
MMKTALKILLPLLIVAIGAGVAMRMVKTRPKAKRAKPRASAMLVDVITVKTGAHATAVSATGSVVAERTVLLHPQVAGVIRSEAIGFEVGRHFKKGELIVRIDDRDHRLNIKQRRAAVTTAQFELTMERGRAHVAKHEWKLLARSNVKTTSAGRALALRQPQKAAAQARIDQAKAALEQAKLNLSRTEVRAPFDCVVREKRASLGQMVSPNAPIARLVGTGRFFVQVSVPMSQLKAVSVPGYNARVGAAVRIRQRTGADDEAVRKGRVVRLLTDLDPNGRMARLLVAVDHPLEAPAKHPEGKAWLPLLIGAYVGVEIEGRVLEGVISVPRLAVHEGGRVWVANKRKLDIRTVHIVWRQATHVLVDSGLSDGERVVVSPIPRPQPGMGLKIKGDTPKASDKRGKPGKVSDAGAASGSGRSARAEARP